MQHSTMKTQEKGQLQIFPCLFLLQQEMLHTLLVRVNGGRVSLTDKASFVDHTGGSIAPSASIRILFTSVCQELASPELGILTEDSPQHSKV